MSPILSFSPLLFSLSACVLGLQFMENIMATALSNPEIGLWYRDIQNRLFEVVAIESEDCIEVQYYDGDISEYDRESWELLCVNCVSEPGISLDFQEDDIEDGALTDKLKSISWENVVDDIEL